MIPGLPSIGGRCEAGFHREIAPITCFTVRHSTKSLHEFPKAVAKDQDQDQDHIPKLDPGMQEYALMACRKW